MKAALLPAGPDPYLLAYWLRNYATWADAVDHLAITVCGQTDPEVRAYVKTLVAAAPHADVTFLDERTDHGLVLAGLIAQSPADLVVLCEDDAFVQRPSVMAECFARLDNVDVVGTARVYGSRELFMRAAELWGTPWAFSPAFLFARTAHLRSVGQDGYGYSPYSGTRWEPGERIASLGMTAKTTLAVDTFGSATFQLLAMGVRYELRDAYRSEEARPDGPWFHVGSLSDGYGYSFLGPDSQREASVENARTDPRDWYKRIAWWSRVLAMRNDGPPDLRRRYREAIAAFSQDAGLAGDLIARAAAAIPPLVTWAE